MFTKKTIAPRPATARLKCLCIATELLINVTKQLHYLHKVKRTILVLSKHT